MAKDAKTRAKARRLHEYESWSMDKIANFIGGITSRTLEKWKVQDKWVKGKYSEVIREKEAESAISAAEKAGLTRALVAETAAKLCNAKDVLMRSALGVTRFPVPDGKISRIDEDGNKSVAVLGVDFELVDDRRAMKDGATLGADILGMKKADAEQERANDNLINLIRSFKPK